MSWSGELGRPAAGRLDAAALVIVIVALAARTWLAATLGLDGDEAYYALWAEWLAPGYLDHPPGVALFVSAGEALLGPSYMGVRLLPLLASALVVLALYRTTRLLVPHPAAPALAVIAYSLTLVAATGFVATPDSPSTLFWTLGLWAAAEAIHGRRPWFWLIVGVSAGLGLVGKYTNAWFGLGLVLFLFATPEGRSQLRLWQLWVGGALAVVVFSPVLWWNFANDWMSFRFQGARVVTFRAEWGRPLGEFLAGQLALNGPVLMLASVLGVGWYASKWAERRDFRLALPVLTSLPLLAYFLFHGLHSRVEANWPQPVLPAMTLVAVAFLCRPAKALWDRWFRGAVMILHAGLGLILIGLVYIQAVWHPLDLGVLDRTRMLRGWEHLATEVQQLADQYGAAAIWVDGSYRLVGQLFFHNRRVGDPRPVRDLDDPQRYGFIPAPIRTPQDMPVLVVAETRSAETARAPLRYFVSAELLAIVPRGGADEPQEVYAIYLARGPTAEFPGNSKD